MEAVAAGQRQRAVHPLRVLVGKPLGVIRYQRILALPVQTAETLAVAAQEVSTIVPDFLPNTEAVLAGLRRKMVLGAEKGEGQFLAEAEVAAVAQYQTLMLRRNPPLGVVQNHTQTELAVLLARQALFLRLERLVLLECTHTLGRVAVVGGQAQLLRLLLVALAVQGAVAVVVAGPQEMDLIVAQAE
jgi:hypothetical protein